MSKLRSPAEHLRWQGSTQKRRQKATALAARVVALVLLFGIIYPTLVSSRSSLAVALGITLALMDLVFLGLLAMHSLQSEARRRSSAHDLGGKRSEEVRRGRHWKRSESEEEAP